ncbi:MAG: phosphogluconate dehydratase [Albidovulum sp.]|nr:phosphogluconate dehydratase [Albidovulum sp.]
MPLNSGIEAVTEEIRHRSAKTRDGYREQIRKKAEIEPARSHLDCCNQAHAYAAMEKDKNALTRNSVPNLGIVTAYNDMLSAHQPFENYPSLIKEAAREAGATAQVAGGVPAMCDGVTQGQSGMELSLFSRDVIALSAAVALSHNAFDCAVFLGVCDKIVPGLAIAAATFGHLPAVFVPAGPMPSGLPNDEKAKIRQEFSAGKIGREKLMAAEMASYHGPGTCTFYGTANTNQMLLEFMGLHLPGASFVNPGTPLRDALTKAGAQRALEITWLGNDYRPLGEILNEKSFVNGIVGLMATGGSTNLLIHLTAMARAAGIILDQKDFAEISDIVPLMARVYPNGLADVNHFHAAGGLSFMISDLLSEGLLHEDVSTVAGDGLWLYCREPRLSNGELKWIDGPEKSLNENILRSASDPFSKTGGLRHLEGNIGKGVMKISAVAEANYIVEAPALVFECQADVRSAFRNGLLNRDVVVVVRFQGPKAKGMPELHSLTPILASVQAKGYKTALVTDGRMSGASGTVPAAIHVVPEAADQGMIAKIRDGDIIRVDANSKELQILSDSVSSRIPACEFGEDGYLDNGRELFKLFRQNVGAATEGASAIV